MQTIRNAKKLPKWLTLSDRSMTHHIDLAVDGLNDVLAMIPLEGSCVPPEAFGPDEFYQSLSPEKKAQFTRVELVRMVGQLRAVQANLPTEQDMTEFRRKLRPKASRRKRRPKEQ